MIFSSGGESDLEYALARRESGVLSWLGFRTGTVIRELADLYAEGLRGHSAFESRQMTAMAVHELLALHAVRRTFIALPTPNGDTYIALALDKRGDKVRGWMPPPELTPRERVFIGLLQGGGKLTGAELESGIPFEIIEEHETNEPWRTQACLGHLTMLGQIKQSEDGSYQLSADSAAAN